VIPIQLALVGVDLAVDVYAIKLVNQSMTLQQLQSSVDDAAIHTGVQLLCPAQKPRRVQVCLVAVSITRRIARRCSVMPIPRSAK